MYHFFCTVLVTVNSFGVSFAAGRDYVDPGGNDIVVEFQQTSVQVPIVTIEDNIFETSEILLVSIVSSFGISDPEFGIAFVDIIDDDGNQISTFHNDFC